MSYKSVFARDLFKGQVIIVTGGGSGLGRCTAHELASLGAHAVIVGRSEDKLKDVVAEITDDGGHASYRICDIRDEEAVKSTVSDTLRDHGRIDGLVNNAGGQYRSSMRDISTKGFEAVVRNNLLGGFLFMRETFVQWMEAHGGSIVNIIADIENGWPNYAHSGAARGGMKTLSETAAAEWAHVGVRVNCVAPGVIASSGFDTYPEEAFHYIRGLAKRMPMGRFGNEAEVSAAIVYLLTPAAAYVSGTTLRVDGAGPNARQTLELEPASNQHPYDGFHRAKPVRT